jgi:hypothetical protein
MAQAPIVRCEDPVAGQDRNDALQRVAQRRGLNSRPRRARSILDQPAVHHASILTTMLLSYPVPCSQNRIGSPAWALP